MDTNAQCCFCGGSIEPLNRDPLTLIMPMDDDAFQQFWTHEDCLRKHLHGSVPLYFDDE